MRSTWICWRRWRPSVGRGVFKNRQSLRDVAGGERGANEPRHLDARSLANLGAAQDRRIQIQLLQDYQTNIDSYPAWQAFLRKRRPPTLVGLGHRARRGLHPRRGESVPPRPAEGGATPDRIPATSRSRSRRCRLGMRIPMVHFLDGLPARASPGFTILTLNLPLSSMTRQLVPDATLAPIGG